MARFHNFQVVSRGSTRSIPFHSAFVDPLGACVRGMWRALRRGDARGTTALDGNRPFAGRQSKRVTYEAGSGTGEVGVENRGLNRWGMNCQAGKPYEGSAWLRAETPTPVALALESGDGSRALATTTVTTAGIDWARHDFTLMPQASDPAGRFAIKHFEKGSVVVGQAFLQPGAWGRFRGLPVRRDVAEAMVDMGGSALRYGGSMVNHPEYRWKQMVGPRDRRPEMAGTWYPDSTNGWGIVDFLDFAEALGVPGIPAFPMGESSEDMADFVE